MNPKTYRPLLGKDVNKALLKLVNKKNSEAIRPLGTNEYVKKMIAHWYEQEFPGDKFPVKLKPYYEDWDL